MVQCDTGQIVGLGFINIKSANSLLWCHTLIYPNKLANRAKHFKTKNAFFYKSIEITYRKVLTIHLKQRDYCSMKTKMAAFGVYILGLALCPGRCHQGSADDKFDNKSICAEVNTWFTLASTS